MASSMSFTGTIMRCVLQVFLEGPQKVVHSGNSQISSLLIGFFPFLVSLTHSLMWASWDHLPNKLPSFKSLSQACFGGIPKWDSLIHFWWVISMALPYGDVCEVAGWSASRQCLLWRDSALLLFFLLLPPDLFQASHKMQDEHYMSQLQRVSLTHR